MDSGLASRGRCVRDAGNGLKYRRYLKRRTAESSRNSYSFHSFDIRQFIENLCLREHIQPENTMAAVPLEIPDPSELPKQADSAAIVAQNGLKAIERLTSDERLDRIEAQTNAKTEHTYFSEFVRDFIRADFNFCAAKMAVARGGKLAALDAEFRVAEEFFKKASAWAKSRPGRSISIAPATITLEIKHASSGRLVRLLWKYDHLFKTTMESLHNRTVTANQRMQALDAAAARINQIKMLCIPDNDRYAPEGVLLPDITAAN